jgi:hypothetical protein
LKLGEVYTLAPRIEIIGDFEDLKKITEVLKQMKN